MARILYVTDGVAPYVVGGMQAVARRHISWLAEAGHDLLTLYSRTAPAVVPDWPGTSQLAPWPKRTALQRLDPWRYVGDLKRYSGAVVTAAAEFRPDLVYAEGPLVQAYLQLLGRAPVIFHPHGLEMFQHKGSLIEDAKSLPLRRIVADHARAADVVLCQGGDLNSLLQDKAGAPSERIRMLPNAGAQRPRSASRRRGGARNRLLFVARAERRKGLDVLLAAIEQFPTVQLTVVGVDRPPAHPANAAFLGLIRDREKLDALFDEADFLVVPSFAEGMPTVILEALSGGLPVIASDVGAVREAVVDGKTGFLVKPGDVGHLSTAIQRALDLPDHDYDRMRGSCAEMFDLKFAPERVRETFLAIVDSALPAG